MNHIERLNRKFGEALGLLANQPRFAWRWTPDLRYYERDHVQQGWREHCWADRLGKCWVLTSERPPVGLLGGVEVPLTEADWWSVFHGARPFPGKLTPYVFAETALLPGLQPSEERTASLIASLREQMQKSLHQLTVESWDEAEADQLANKREFFDMTADWWPVGWGSKTGAHTPGARGGAISFGSWSK